jgi:hypothetical protein
VRVLYLPHGRQQKRFVRLLSAGAERRGWRTAVLAPTASRKAYPFIADDTDYFTLPDFLTDAKTGVGNDAGTAALIADAEQANGIPAARLILAGERDIGRGFGRPFYYLPERQVAGAVVADNELPSRIVAAIFARMADVLSSFKPDIVVTGNIAAPHHLALMMIARLRGIPALIGRPSKIHDDRSFWTADFAMLNDALAESVAARAARPSLPDPAGLAYLAEFRNKPQTIAYIERTWRAGAAESLFSRHRYFAELLYLQLKHALLRRRGAPPKPFWPSLVEYYRTEWLAFRQKRYFARPTPDALAKMRYVYMAMHKEPELAINYQAFAWHNQYEAAAKLAAALPHGIRLVVREHKFNRGRRPSRFYAELSALPNVVVADPFDDQFKYITNADVIVTDNGSTGWEGLLLGKTVVTLDRTFYDAAGLSYPIRDPSQLGPVLLKLLHERPSPPADADARLASLVAAEYAATVADDGEDALVADIATLEVAAAKAKTRERQAAVS